MGRETSKRLDREPPIMNESQQPEITQVVPWSQAILVLTAGMVVGVAASILADPFDWSVYVLVPLGAVVGTVFGGVGLGIVAGLKTRRRDGEGD